LIPPTLVIESLSPGHELHDQQTKRRWYAEFDIPNYWLLDAFRQSLDCLVLRNGEYKLDAGGKNHESVSPALFPGLSIPLQDIWTT
jgi:Uma2 family endonuclease